ncbi:MAG TPA: MBL fold metallo-hydrolase [Syntrophobacteraceae bacterium]|nr:MBL fold metallo-hydrolase [Syntrophobacteraceae bacterium]
MSLFFQVLASGSRGNAVLVASAKTRLLVDAGMTCKELTGRMARTPIEAASLDALLISHEHNDHVSAAGTLSRKFNLPVYMTRGTLDNLPANIGRCASVTVFGTGKCFEIGDLVIQPFATSHDAAEPAGFTIENCGVRLGICTDLGIATNLVKVRLKGCHGLVVEANHDINRLLEGPYPWFLKQRIKSAHGHLSNEEACDLLEAVHHEGLRCVILAHLSETNNHPDLVLESCRKLCCSPRWECVRFELGKQDDLAIPVELS